jgi:hypothetical protein
MTNCILTSVRRKREAELFRNVVDKIYRWSPNQFHRSSAMDMVTIFCDIDEFCRSVLATRSLSFPTPPGSKKSRGSSLSWSEVMTILVWFQVSHYRTFKHL